MSFSEFYNVGSRRVPQLVLLYESFIFTFKKPLFNQNETFRCLNYFETENQLQAIKGHEIFREKLIRNLLFHAAFVFVLISLLL